MGPLRARVGPQHTGHHEVMPQFLVLQSRSITHGGLTGRPEPDWSADEGPRVSQSVQQPTPHLLAFKKRVQLPPHKHDFKST